MHKALRRQYPQRLLCWGDAGIGDVSELFRGRKSTGLRCITCLWLAAASSIRRKHAETENPQRQILRVQGRRSETAGAWFLLSVSLQVEGNGHRRKQLHDRMKDTSCLARWREEQWEQGHRRRSWRDVALRCPNGWGATAQGTPAGALSKAEGDSEAELQNYNHWLAFRVPVTADRLDEFGGPTAMQWHWDVHFRGWERVRGMSSVRGRAAPRSAGQTNSHTHEYAWGRGPRSSLAALMEGAELEARTGVLLLSLLMVITTEVQYNVVLL